MNLSIKVASIAGRQQKTFWPSSQGAQLHTASAQGYTYRIRPRLHIPHPPKATHFPF